MARDLMFYFDKKSPFARHELGEIQSDFNMGLTIDGAKDNMQVQVYGFVEKEVEPNTILFHNATRTWWVVSRDIVKRYANESTYFYIHNLTISGAIELLNARDLTDCGFNDRTYTIEQFIKRLFKRSTFEFTDLLIEFGNNIDGEQIVDYIKSYENYTLLSALRDFLSGYNCDAKLVFRVNPVIQHKIITAVLRIIPRTGNVDYPMVDISEFNDVRETKTINKESYGATVISNAQNVVSTLAKIYPQVGGAKISADNYNITPSNAVLRLPTPIYKVNWIRLLHPVQVHVYADTGNDRIDEYVEVYPYNRPSLEKEFENIAQRIAQFLEDQYTLPEQEIYDYIKQFEDVFYEKTTKAGSITVRTGWSVKPTSASAQDLIAPTNDSEFKFRMIAGLINNNVNPINYNLLIGTKEDHDSVVLPDRCMYYERGGNEIHNFNWMGVIGGGSSNGSGLPTYASSDLNSNNTNIVEHEFTPLRFVRIKLRALSTNTWYLYRFDASSTFFQINYIPMSDIKIKYDNERNNLDSKLYNQNGKLNDSVALSKLIDSYSKEIQSNNITRYMHYTDFDDIPKVGTIVKNGNDKYVINNISLDFYINETYNNNLVGYYIECEFTMSKYVSTKSLMVNPNSNIRDYGIPQKFNVKRKQTYRDYFELSLTQDADANQETPYVGIDKYIDSGSNTNKEYDHTAFIKINYTNNLNESKSWYYQLNTTSYILSKALYEIVDFQDNNIIGYDLQNIWTGFTMSKLFNNNWKTTNIPISYVDENGKFEGIEIQMVNKTETNKLYDNISIDENNVAMYSAHPFVGENFYNGKPNVYQGAVDIKDYEIVELDYDKDAIEVPVFEYSMQLGDTAEVEIGERILDNKTGILQIYTCEIKDANTTTQLNANKVFSGLEVSGDSLTDDNYDRQVEVADTSAVSISFENDNTIMRIKIFASQSVLFYGNDVQEFVYQGTTISQVQTPKSALLGKDIVIYKNVIKSLFYDIENDEADCEYQNDLMFIIHNPQESNFDGDDLLVNVNYYKLK